MAQSKLIPPFVPHLEGPADVSHFDDKHTQDTKDTGATIEAAQQSKQSENQGLFMTDPAFLHIDNFDYVAPGLRKK